MIRPLIKITYENSSLVHDEMFAIAEKQLDHQFH